MQDRRDITLLAVRSIRGNYLRAPRSQVDDPGYRTDQSARRAGADEVTRGPVWGTRFDDWTAVGLHRSGAGRIVPAEGAARRSGLRIRTLLTRECVSTQGAVYIASATAGRRRARGMGHTNNGSSGRSDVESLCSSLTSRRSIVPTRTVGTAHTFPPYRRIRRCIVLSKIRCGCGKSHVWRADG